LVALWLHFSSNWLWSSFQVAVLNHHQRW